MERPTSKINVRVFSEDLDTLKASYPGTGYNRVVRALVSTHCRKLRARARDKMEGGDPVESLIQGEA